MNNDVSFFKPHFLLVFILFISSPSRLPSLTPSLPHPPPPLFLRAMTFPSDLTSNQKRSLNPRPPPLLRRTVPEDRTATDGLYRPIAPSGRNPRKPGGQDSDQWEGWRALWPLMAAWEKKRPLTAVRPGHCCCVVGLYVIPQHHWTFG